MGSTRLEARGLGGLLIFSFAKYSFYLFRSSPSSFSSSLYIVISLSLSFSLSLSLFILLHLQFFFLNSASLYLLYQIFLCQLRAAFLIFIFLLYGFRFISDLIFLHELMIFMLEAIHPKISGIVRLEDQRKGRYEIDDF